MGEGRKEVSEKSTQKAYNCCTYADMKRLYVRKSSTLVIVCVDEINEKPVPVTKRKMNKEEDIRGSAG